MSYASALEQITLYPPQQLGNAFYPGSGVPYGATGITGPPGPQGAQGDPGVQGEQGPTGAPGDKYNTRTDNATINPYPPFSIPEATLTCATNNPLAYIPGNSVVVVKTDDQFINFEAVVYSYSPISGIIGLVNISNVNGFNGLPVTGEWNINLDGIDGADGATGAQGDTGATGDIGPTGPQGDIGVTGAQGDTGATGEIGPTGSQGIQGNQGIPGAPGLPGAQGPTGAQGNAGATGVTGATGATGSAGSSLRPSQAYWIAKNGNDATGNGSIGLPFSTIQKAVSLANNNSIGTTINVMPGIYTENLNLTNENVTIVGYGSAPNAQLNTSLIGNHTCAPSAGTNSILFAGLTMANPTPSTFMIDMTGSSAGNLTLTNCVLGDTGVSTISGYINVAGPHRVSIERITANNTSQSTTTCLVSVSSATLTASLSQFATFNNNPIIQVTGSSNPLTLSYSQLASTWSSGNLGTNSNGVIRLGATLGSLQAHSIVNCGINSSALATAGSGGVPAVGIDATGSQLIFYNNVCLTRFNALGGNQTAHTVESTGVGSTATNTYYEGNNSTSNAFAHSIVSGGNYTKNQMTIIN